MNPNQALWEKGDFTRLARTMRGSGETLVKSIGVTRGMKVLDLGCGDGTTAIPEARLGADVLGVDIARNLVEAGNKRAQEMDLANVRFQEGDACDLHPIADRSFASSSASSARCSRPSRSRWPRRWFASPSPAGGSSWATGSRAIRRWWHRS